MGWLFWLLLLYMASTAAVCIAWCRWAVQAVKAGPGKIWSATSALSVFYFSKCLDDFGSRLSVFKRRVQSCFYEAIAYGKQTMVYAMTKFMALVRVLTTYPVVLVAMSMASIVEKWIEWFVPSWFITAVATGAHVMHLLITGCVCAAFWTALGFGAHGVEHAPRESIFLARHAMVASMLRYCTSEGAFIAMDDAVASVEWVRYGQEGCKRHKKQLRRQAKKGHTQDSSVSSCLEQKPVPQPASASAQAVTSSAGPLAESFSPKTNLIGSFQPPEQLLPVAESVNAPASSSRQQQATTEEEHMAFCCHLYSLLERAQLLCLEHMSEGQAAIEKDVSQAANLTQEVMPRVQGICVDDTTQHVSGFSASAAATAVGSQVQDPSAGASVQAVQGDSHVGSAQEIGSWVQDGDAGSLYSQPDSQLAVAASSLASLAAATTAAQAPSFLPRPPSMSAVPQTLGQPSAESSQAANSTQEVVPRVQGICVDDFTKHVSGVSASAAASTVGSQVQDPSAGASIQAVQGDSPIGSAQEIGSRKQDANADRTFNNNISIPSSPAPAPAQTASSLLEAEIDQLEDELAAVEDANRAARPSLPHRLSSFSLHLAARPERQEHDDMQRALALSMEDIVQPGTMYKDRTVHPSIIMCPPPAAAAWRKRLARRTFWPSSMMCLASAVTLSSQSTAVCSPVCLHLIHLISASICQACTSCQL